MVGTEGFSDALAGYLASVRESGSEASIRHRCVDFLCQSLGVSLEAGDELEQRVFRGRADAVLGRLVFEFKRDLTASLADAEAQLRYYLTDLHRQDPAIPYTGVACDGRRFRVYRPTYDATGQAALEEIGSLDLERSIPSPSMGEGQDGGDIPLTSILSRKGRGGRSVADPQDAYLWLDGLFAHFRSSPATPTARAIVVALGPNSPTFRHAFTELLGLYRRVKENPEVAVRYREWQSYLSIVYGSAVGDEALFVRHTYLSLVARLIARFFLDVGASRHVGTVPLLASAEALGKTVNGEYFREQGVNNFIEDDFFTWPLVPEIIEDGVDLVRRLASSLAAYDFAQARQDLLKGLYQELVDPETRHDLGEYYTPDWLAQYMLEEELGLSRDPDRSVLDPACGSGTFLFTAIRLIAAARLRRGEDAFDTLLHVLDQVMGMDVHPVAVTIARTNYLLALGELIQGPHPPVLLPVYLSNAIILPGSTAETEPLGGYPEPVHTVATSEPGVVFELPHSVATDPEMLDWLFDRFTNYLRGAGARRQVQSEEEATQEVLNAFHNYLVAPKPRTPIPEPLSDFAAEVMGRTARTLIQLYLQGKDHVWLYILKNIPASIYLAQRKFDLVVGNPPWLSMRYIRNPQYRQRVRTQILQDYQLLSRQATHLFTHMELATLFFARCADLYLKGPGTPPYPPLGKGGTEGGVSQGGDTGGVIAMVMPRAVLTADQHQQFTAFSFKEGGSQVLKLERVLDLEGVAPLFNVPACVLIARKGQRTALRQAQGERGTISVRGEPVEPQVAQGTTYPVPGVVFQGEVPSRNASWAEAQPRLEQTDTTFDRQGGKLLPEGESIPQGPASYYQDKFFNGATLYPRNMWFVRLRQGPLGYDPQRPPLETDPETAQRAKPPWKDIQMSGNVEARFLYATLPSGDLMPFGYTRLRLVVLPVAREGGRLTLVNRDRALEQGYFGLAEWVARAEREWADKGRRDERGQLRIPNIHAQIDYRRKIIRQSPTIKYKVIYNVSGTNTVATVLDLEKIPDSEQSGVSYNAFIADYETYYYETNEGNEAYYLAAVINSQFLDAAIKPLQARGLFGPRHISKHIWKLPVPQFNRENASHQRLAELGQECHSIVAEVLPEIAARYRSTGKIRGEVRRLLAPQLAEIDGLVKGLLGVSPPL